MNLRNYILPTPDNDYAPPLLQKTAFLLMCGLVLLTFVTVNVQTVAWLTSNRLVAGVLPSVVFDTTNARRVEEGGVPLWRSVELDEAARLKAEHMAEHGYFSHYSRDGVSPWYWLEQVSYPYARAAENLAVHFSDSKEITDAWMESPAHRANILNQDYFEVGVGTAEGEYLGVKTVFVVQFLAARAAPLQPYVEEARVMSKMDTPIETNSEGTPLMFNESGHREAVEGGLGYRDLVPAAMVSAATTTALLPISREQYATLTPVAGSSEASVLATTPNTVLRIIYTVLGTLVAVLLLFSLALAMRYHRPWQTAYGVFLLLLMTGLFYLHSTFTADVVVAASLL